MASLAFVTKEVREILKYGGILAVFLFLLFFVVKGLIYVQNVLYPKAPIPPKQEFGKLPQLIFPNQEAAGITYRISPLVDKLPDLPDRTNVYKLVQPQPDLLALNKAKDILRPSYFTNEPKIITEAIYQWTHDLNGVSIQYNIVTKNFTFGSNYLDNPNFSSSGLLPDSNQIKKDVISSIGRIGAVTGDLDEEKTSVIYLQLRGRLLVAADNLANARYAKIDFWQKPIDNIPIIYTAPTESIMTFIVSYPNGNFTILDGQYLHYEPDLNVKSDYSIKTTQKAFEDLQNGNAFVINPNNLKNVEITDVSVQYYLNKNTNVYLQPIIVFKGVDFTAYVDAIPIEYLNL